MTFGVGHKNLFCYLGTHRMVWHVRKRHADELGYDTFFLFIIVVIIVD